ncbi:MAG: amidohydrolase/deacetylase family metallohydrolase [Planctomycetota bacterium]|jgi:dihydroorotase|nr:amidohydrolase/deacetylase family metallohydrolase [Planctomycetota bacterium]MDP7130939.1 amidohydrolase/deacetylase family metallohydrolase [Planctomycetota bacterium]MDP7251747.1 amidohydrolase/deacetylase family metallohydrolase [Planctomycetota bacterium]
MLYDLLIRGGTLIDPAQGIHGERDVAFANGVVAGTGEDLQEAEAETVVDARGRIVTPGLIDLHVHAFEGVSYFGVGPDATCLAKGATTVLDAGTAGADIFPGFRKFVIDACRTRVFALLNISSPGMLTRDIGELENPDHANVKKVCKSMEEHPDVILGVKVRLTKNNIVSERAGIEPLYRAREAADATGTFIMVHPQSAWCESIDDVMAVMGERDILTHCFHDHPCGVLDEQGQVRDSVRDAAERGVIFDVGHGSGSFVWEVAERALDQGLIPHTLSTDLHTGSLNGPVYDLATVVDKFLYLGMSLEDAIARVTSAPAQAIRQESLGTLSVGSAGDAAVFEIQEGEFELQDSPRKTRTANRKLVPVAVVKGGCLCPGVM